MYNLQPLHEVFSKPRVPIFNALTTEPVIARTYVGLSINEPTLGKLFTKRIYELAEFHWQDKRDNVLISTGDFCARTVQ